MQLITEEDGVVLLSQNTNFNMGRKVNIPMFTCHMCNQYLDHITSSGIS